MGRACRQLPLDPADWPLVCFTFEGAYYIDISLPLASLANCQDVTSLITRELNSRGVTVLSCIDNFRGMTTDQATSVTHLTSLRSLLAKLRLREAEHKASPPAQVTVWLSLQFDTVAITVSFPKDKLAEIQLLQHGASLGQQTTATLQDLCILLGKLL